MKGERKGTGAYMLLYFRKSSNVYYKSNKDQ